jgi:hypothetical protein
MPVGLPSPFHAFPSPSLFPVSTSSQTIIRSNHTRGIIHLGFVSEGASCLLLLLLVEFLLLLLVGVMVRIVVVSLLTVVIVLLLLLLLLLVVVVVVVVVVLLAGFWVLILNQCHDKKWCVLAYLARGF